MEDINNLLFDCNEFGPISYSSEFYEDNNPNKYCIENEIENNKSSIYIQKNLSNESTNDSLFINDFTNFVKNTSL